MVRMPLPCCCWLVAFYVSFLALNFCSELSELDQHRSRLSGETATEFKEHQMGPTASIKRHPTSDNLGSVPERSRWLQPRDTWMLFMRHAHRGDSKRRRKGNARKAKHQPLGAHGPSGTRRDTRTEEELLHDLKLLVKEMVHQRKKLDVPQCDDCEEPDEEEANTEKEEMLTVIPPPVIETRPRSRVEAAFHCRLKNNVSVEPRTVLEMKPYYVHDMEESFQRGPGVNLTSGHYTTPSTGFYMFSASMHIDPKVGETGDRHIAGHVRVSICTQSQCLYKTRLENVASFGGGGSSLFTLTVGGTLFLQVDDYASIFVDNAAGASLTVLCGSHFSGLLLGS